MDVDEDVDVDVGVGVDEGVDQVLAMALVRDVVDVDGMYQYELVSHWRLP